jgi:hypothetical protein
MLVGSCNLQCWALRSDRDMDFEMCLFVKTSQMIETEAANLMLPNLISLKKWVLVYLQKL